MHFDRSIPLFLINHWRSSAPVKITLRL